MKKLLTGLALCLLCLMLALPVLAEVAVGDSLIFGTYEQDNDPSNGPEPIEWLVLDTVDNKALLLSCYALDSRQFHNEWIDVTWADSSLRAWLNDDFIAAAFTESEQAALLETLVVTANNKSYDTPGGNDVTDRVFILSVEEAQQYFSSAKTRRAQGTAYAVEQQLFVKDTGSNAGNSWWWLRTMGVTPDTAVYVKEDGTILFKGVDVDIYSSGVRPAVWVSLGALE